MRPSPSLPAIKDIVAEGKSTLASPECKHNPTDPHRSHSSGQVHASPERTRVIRSNSQTKEAVEGRTDTTKNYSSLLHVKPQPDQLAKRIAATQIPHAKGEDLGHSLASRIPTLIPAPMDTQPNFPEGYVEEHPAYNEAGSMAQQVVDEAKALRDHLNHRRINEPNFPTCTETLGSELTVDRGRCGTDFPQACQAVELSRSLRDLVNRLVDTVESQTSPDVVPEVKNETTPSICKVDGSNVDNSPSPLKEALQLNQDAKSDHHDNRLGRRPLFISASSLVPRGGLERVVWDDDEGSYKFLSIEPFVAVTDPNLPSRTPTPPSNVE